MIEDAIQEYSRLRQISRQDALQVFFQIIVLKHLSAPRARFMGGTALVLGHGNPRFSEDIDLTQVASPQELKPGLDKAARELGDWLGHSVTVTAPKSGTRTWRLQCGLDRAHTVRLHIDSQPYSAYTNFPIVVQFPTLPPLVCASLSVEEIMADKIIAVGNRAYLGGRDLFDLWFHWLKNADWNEALPRIQNFVQNKFRERRLQTDPFLKKLNRLLTPEVYLKRIQDEWRRYLPTNFQTTLIQNTIVERVKLLPSHFLGLQ